MRPKISTLTATILRYIFEKVSELTKLIKITKIKK